MLKLVATQLQIRSEVDLNYKTQQYELGLMVCARTMGEYLDKTTMAQRLSKLISEFSNYLSLIHISEPTRRS